ncbi:MAG: amidohydrolase family protein, partial [Acidimicrobiales bacterium]|nr:amidohydrolase family protein [Acidimicrobiales bacterium]
KFLPGMFERLQILARKMNGWFPEDPVETFLRHIWINPFWEDQVDDVIAAVGVDRVIFGSDWPHIEGLPEPLQYKDEVAHLSGEDQRLILSDNARSLNVRHPA